jgi:hypothetical protein
MRRYLAFTVLGVAAIWMALAGERMAGPVPVADAFNLPVQPLGLGMKLAGGWFFDLYLGGSTTATPVMVTLNADGSIVISGSPLSGGTTIASAHGAWKAVGPNTMVGTVLAIGYNSDATPGWYEKAWLNWTLSRDGNLLEGTLPIGLYSIDQDPLVEDPAFGIISCTCIGKRLAAQ